MKTSAKTCLLLVNLGTPEAPTPAAVKTYLREFLSDPRVVQIPKPIWWLILNGIILQTRPRKSAKAYQSIWSERGSPLMVHTQDLAAGIQALTETDELVVDYAMRYGQPFIPARLEAHRRAGVEEFIILPLYPQYSAATTASIYDKVVETFNGWKQIPSFRFISDYHLNAGYVAAVADSIQQYWQTHGKPEKLLFSLHGLPAVSRKQGDPYYDQCVASTKAIAEKLGLDESQWMLVFQSRFGAQEWLKPYCVEVLKELPTQGVKSIDVVCPGFAVDCLETLEEIAIANQEIFREAGGEQYRYIPALNSAPSHTQVLLNFL